SPHAGQRVGPPSRAPGLPPRQPPALDALRGADGAVELRLVMRKAKCGSGPVEALVAKGFARRVQRRVDRFSDSTESGEAHAGPLELNADQLVAWSQIEPVLKDGGFHAFL